MEPILPVFHLLTFVQFREYAEHVRERIESLGLLVEPLQLNPTVSLAEALEDSASRGLLYTIIITNQHESHRSVTLTILHGRNPQGVLMSFLLVSLVVRGSVEFFGMSRLMRPLFFFKVLCYNNLSEKFVPFLR